MPVEGEISHKRAALPWACSSIEKGIWLQKELVVGVRGGYLREGVGVNARRGRVKVNYV